MFGYSCPMCGKGVVCTRYFKKYEARRKDVRWIIPRAKIGVCDSCGERIYTAKELKRWEKLRPK